jgi:hypothetical protein
MMNGINDELILATRLLLATLFLIFGWGQGERLFRYRKSDGAVWPPNSKHVTGFTDNEEKAMGLTKVVLFLVEGMLKLGAVFSKVVRGARGQRRLADHWTGSGFLRPCREDADGGSKAKGHTGCHRADIVDRGRQVVTFSGRPLGVSARLKGRGQLCAGSPTK